MYREFSDRFAKLEQLNEILAASVTKPNHAPTDTSASKPKHVPTAASARKPKQLTKLKRATVSPKSGGRGKKARSEQLLPTPISTLSESEDSLMEESDFSDDSSEKHVIQKDVTPAAISGMPGSAEIGDAPSKLDEELFKTSEINSVGDENNLATLLKLFKKYQMIELSD
ncbi:hypothetical protein TNCT_5111 [Trichonephila clavata]|uniref:Uncharacterized protein n=1 Tax=Trichonephila clavata TaxID=2740835 RepID=A0A8X6HNI2_TRICU|nr:hypothetical protein TNCT_5111 [Trichonephila clavata]